MMTTSASFITPFKGSGFKGSYATGNSVTLAAGFSLLAPGRQLEASDQQPVASRQKHEKSEKNS
jgi:hypothetical protein